VFDGCSLLEVTTFLRLAYSPDHATDDSLRALHQHGLRQQPHSRLVPVPACSLGCVVTAGSSGGCSGGGCCLLAGVAGLAHRLDARSMLARIAAYLQGEQGGGRAGKGVLAVTGAATLSVRAPCQAACPALPCVQALPPAPALASW